MSSPVTAILREILDEATRMGDSPRDINGGYCADVATIVWERFPLVEIVDDEELGRDIYTHTFLRFEGRYYDIEALEGVVDWRDLPIFGRQRSEGLQFNVTTTGADHAVSS